VFSILSKDSSLDQLNNYASIFLEENFRKKLIETGIQKAGSMNQLGRIMGYMGDAPNWNIKQILHGKRAVPLYRLKRLCTFLGMSLNEIEKHVLKTK